MENYYDYLENVTEDAKAAILENMEYWDFSNRDELEEIANDELFNDDNVTGNASGSYYCSTWKAEEALCHNWDILKEACDDFGYGLNTTFCKGAEYCDVIIRCYLLGQTVSAAIDELEEEGKISYPEEEEEN